MSRYGNDEAGYRVIVASEWLDDINKFAAKEDTDDKDFMNRYRYSSNRGKVKIDVAEWTEPALKKLADLLDKKVAAGDGSAKLSRGVLQQWIEIRNNPSGATVSRFENLAETLKKYIATSDKRWVFEQMDDGNMLPWFVAEAVFHPPSPYSRAHVSIKLLATNSGFPKNRNRSDDVGKTISYLPEEFNKKLTMSQYLEVKGYRLETEARTKSYEAEVERFLGFYDEDGLQMSVKGKAFLQNGWSESGFRNIEKSGRPAKMVIDPPDKDRSESAITCNFWDKNEEKLWQLPVHPILECFDLEEHANYRVHVNNAEPYIYDTKVGDKLVLPQDSKDFIEVLIEHSKNKFVDIVGGKEGGTIIMLEGPPGVGKTLTAEVYSEVMERPLYKVQSSQLGTDPQSVEKELKVVLQRSERWGAILLIDEADVYIHARNDDIEQNAIVGVFLRVLEYYRGVLFMTTNRGTIVDDAIISRLTARFRYEVPDINDQRKLWRILADQNNIKLADAEIEIIILRMQRLSGRDIKNLLKLAFVSEIRTGNPVTAKSVERVAKFRQMGTE